MVRVVGSDPGTSSLDLLLLDDGTVVDQARLLPFELRDDPESLVRVLHGWRPIDLVAAPSGYGLPLVRGDAFCEDHLDQMSLVRPDQRGREDGIVGFRAWVRSFLRSGAPIVFLPGGLHLPTIPPHRKPNTVDMGTADKVAVAALALWFDAALLGRLRPVNVRGGRDRLSFLGDPGRRARPPGRRIGGDSRPDRPSLRRMLGRRSRLLARPDLQGRRCSRAA